MVSHYSFASSTGYYGVTYNLQSLPGNKYVNASISGLVEIPALIYVICVSNRWVQLLRKFILIHELIQSKLE